MEKALRNLGLRIQVLLVEREDCLSIGIGSASLLILLVSESVRHQRGQGGGCGKRSDASIALVSSGRPSLLSDMHALFSKIEGNLSGTRCTTGLDGRL